MKYNPVEVIWRDSNIYLAQCNKDDGFTYETITSYGNLVQDNAEQVVLAGDCLQDDVRRVIVIPQENIISLKKLK